MFNSECKTNKIRERLKIQGRKSLFSPIQDLFFLQISHLTCLQVSYIHF